MTTAAVGGDGFSNDGVLGHPVTLHASGGMPSSPFLVLASPARAHIPSGLNRDFLVDRSGALILKALRYDATGRNDLTSNLPNDNVLVGTSAQATGAENAAPDAWRPRRVL